MELYRGRSIMQTRSDLRLSAEEGNPPIITAAGELDCCNCHCLQELISEVIASISPVLTLSLKDLSFVDSSGLRTLAIAARKARDSGGCIRIASLSPQLSRMLDLTGLDSLFDYVSEATEPLHTRVSSRPHRIRSLVFLVAPELSSCRTARDQVCSFAEELGADWTTVDDIRLAVGEAASNAVRHGERSGDIKFQCQARDGKIRVTVRYRSERFDPENVPSPSLEEPTEGGMGIHFMRLVMDRVAYDFSDGHAIVTLEKELRTLHHASATEHPGSRTYTPSPFHR